MLISLSFLIKDAGAASDALQIAESVLGPSTLLLVDKVQTLDLEASRRPRRWTGT
jgi:hypothetical protein